MYVCVAGRMPRKSQLYLTPASKVLTFTNVSAVLAGRGAYRVSNLVRFYQQARDLAVIWTGVCLVLVAVAFSLKMAENFSRGVALTFTPRDQPCSSGAAMVSMAVPSGS